VLKAGCHGNTFVSANDRIKLPRLICFDLSKRNTIIRHFRRECAKELNDWSLKIINNLITSLELAISLNELVYEIEKYIRLACKI